VVDGLLKGLDQQVSSLKYSMLDSILRIGAIVLIVPAYGIKGFLLIMIFSNILTSSLNVRRLLKVTGLRIRWGDWVLKPLLAAGTPVALASCLQKIPAAAGFPAIPAIILFSAAVVLIYGGLLFLFGCIGVEDIRWIKQKTMPRDRRV